ncbi:hypothetical protein LBMAG57_35780 [Verrucomicrobiota bacterium]|nr:hypothetical protein LBMAG57_35780 [Verrucomicrobiota bacterium]
MIKAVYQITDDVYAGHIRHGAIKKAGATGVVTGEQKEDAATNSQCRDETGVNFAECAKKYRNNRDDGELRNRQSCNVRRSDDQDVRDHVNGDEEQKLKYDAAENSESVEVADQPPRLNPSNNAAKCDERGKDAYGDCEYATKKPPFGDVFEDGCDEEVFFNRGRGLR